MAGSFVRQPTDQSPRADRFFKSRAWRRVAPVAQAALNLVRGKSNPIWHVRADQLRHAAQREGAGYTAYDQDFTAFIKTLGLFPWVTACIRANATAGAGQPIVVRRRLGNDEYEPLPDHPLQELFNRPQKGVALGKAGRSLRWHLYDQLEYTGTALAVIEGDEIQNVGVANAREMWVMPTRRVFVDITDDPENPIAGYWYNGPIQKQYIPWWKVVAFGYPNILDEDPVFGLSKLRGLELTLNLLFKSRQWNHAYFANAARPSSTVEVPGSMDAAEYERLKADLDARTGMNQAHRPWILENGAKMNKSGGTPQDAEFVELWKLGREEVLASFGCPPAVVGLLEQSGAFANVREQFRRHLTGTVMQMTNLHDDAFNTSSIVSSYGDDIEIMHDFSGEEALQKDRLQEAQVNAVYLDRNVIFPNEVRGDLGKEPIDAEGMDEPKPPGPNPFDLMQSLRDRDEREDPDGAAGDGEGGDGQETEPDDRDDEDAKWQRALTFSDGLIGATIYVDAASKMSPDALLDWCEERGFHTKGPMDLIPGEFHALQLPETMATRITQPGLWKTCRHPDGPVFGFAVLKNGSVPLSGLGPYSTKAVDDGSPRAKEWREKVLRRQQVIERAWMKLVKRKMEDYQANVLAALQRFKTAGLSLGRTKTDEIPADVLDAIAREAAIAEQWFDDFLDMSEATFKDVADHEWAQIAYTGPTDLDDLGLSPLIRERVAHTVSSIEKTQVETLRALVFQAQADSDSIDTLTKTIRERFKFEKRWKAAQIARTESVYLMNAGQKEAWRVGGIEEKEWLSSRDIDVRPSHESADGQKVGIDDNFQVGDGAGPHPGAIGLAEEDINCRCGMKAGLPSE